MIVENLITGFHTPHIVSGLIVPHTFPTSRAIFLEVFDRIDVGFRFHQPVLLRHELLTPKVSRGAHYGARNPQRRLD